MQDKVSLGDMIQHNPQVSARTIWHATVSAVRAVFVCCFDFEDGMSLQREQLVLHPKGQELRRKASTAIMLTLDDH